MSGPTKWKWSTNSPNWEPVPPTMAAESEILWRTGIARNCMTLLKENILKSSIWIHTKVRLYKVYVLPVLMCGSEAWSVTKTLARRLDASDSWSLCKILWIPHTDRVTNATVRQTIGCCPVFHLTQERRLVVHAEFQQDHHLVIEASLRPPSHWRRPCGRPRSTWLRGSILMCSQLTLGSTQPGEKPVTIHTLWWCIVDTATLHQRARHCRERDEAIQTDRLDFQHEVLLAFYSNGYETHYFRTMGMGHTHRLTET